MPRFVRKLVVVVAILATLLVLSEFVNTIWSHHPTNDIKSNEIVFQQQLQYSQRTQGRLRLNHGRQERQQTSLGHQKGEGDSPQQLHAHIALDHSQDGPQNSQDGYRADFVDPTGRPNHFTDGNTFLRTSENIVHPIHLFQSEEEVGVGGLHRGTNDDGRDYQALLREDALKRSKNSAVDFFDSQKTEEQEGRETEGGDWVYDGLEDEDEMAKEGVMQYPDELRDDGDGQETAPVVEGEEHDLFDHITDVRISIDREEEHDGYVFDNYHVDARRGLDLEAVGDGGYEDLKENEEPISAVHQLEANAVERATEDQVRPSSFDSQLRMSVSDLKKQPPSLQTSSNPSRPNVVYMTKQELAKASRETTPTALQSLDRTSSQLVTVPSMDVRSNPRLQGYPPRIPAQGRPPRIPAQGRPPHTPAQGRPPRTPAKGAGPTRPSVKRRDPRRAHPLESVKLSKETLKLQGQVIPANSPLVLKRGFPEWHNSSTVASHLKYLHVAINNTGIKKRPLTGHSLNPNILARGEFQQAKVDQFCQRQHLLSQLPTHPSSLNTLLQVIWLTKNLIPSFHSNSFKHLLYDDSKKIVFCYVPKNGCSNMKRLLLILNGLLSPDSVDHRPPEDVLKKVNSFRHLTPQQALYKLNNYYKMIIVRNPLEKLLSAYRNKIEPPLNFKNRNAFPDKVKLFILQRFRRGSVQQWLRRNQSTPLSPTFSEFLLFMSTYPLSEYNEHFMPVLDLCSPCAVHYDFYANFKSLDYDVFAVLDYLNISSAFYPKAISHIQTPTSTYLETYFGKLPWQHKKSLFGVFSQELQFYYSLYPEEEGMHRTL